MVCSIVELGTMTVQFLEKSSESVDNGGGCETDVGDKDPEADHKTMVESDR